MKDDSDEGSERNSAEHCAITKEDVEALHDAARGKSAEECAPPVDLDQHLVQLLERRAFNFRNSLLPTFRDLAALHLIARKEKRPSRRIANLVGRRISNIEEFYAQLQSSDIRKKIEAFLSIPSQKLEAERQARQTLLGRYLWLRPQLLQYVDQAITTLFIEGGIAIMLDLSEELNIPRPPTKEPIDHIGDLWKKQSRASLTPTAGRPKGRKNKPNPKRGRNEMLQIR